MAESVMPVRCAGCAFTDGTEANRDKLTSVTKALCLEARVPFYCHANAVADVIPRDEKRICCGYAEVVLISAASGYEPPAWKRAVALEGLILMEESEERAERGEPEPKDVAQQLVRRVTARLLENRP